MKLYESTQYVNGLATVFHINHFWASVSVCDLLGQEIIIHI